MNTFPNDYNFNNKEWFQPVEESPSVWQMLMQLLQSGWENLWNNRFKPTTKTASLEDGISPTLTKRYSFKDFPLIKERAFHPYTTHPQLDSPYRWEDLTEEETEIETACSLPEATMLKTAVSPLTLHQRAGTEAQAITPPDSLESIEDINSWIAFHIDTPSSKDEDTQTPVLTPPNAPTEPISIELLNATASSENVSPRQEDVRQTQASINDLVNQYFASKDASL
jgi:hypothetical protein